MFETNCYTAIDKEYSIVFKQTISSMERLQNSRMIAVRTLQNVERYIISIANRPRNFDTQIGQIKIAYTNFMDTLKEVQEIEQKKNKNIVIICKFFNY